MFVIVYPKSYKSTDSGSHLLDHLVKLIYYKKLVSRRLDIHL